MNVLMSLMLQQKDLQYGSKTAQNTTRLPSWLLAFDKKLRQDSMQIIELAASHQLSYSSLIMYFAVLACAWDYHRQTMG